MIDRPVAFAPAPTVKAGQRGDALQQGRLPSPVLADDDRNRPLEAQRELIPQKRQAERIRLAVGHA